MEKKRWGEPDIHWANVFIGPFLWGGNSMSSGNFTACGEGTVKWVLATKFLTEEKGRRFRTCSPVFSGGLERIASTKGLEDACKWSMLAMLILSGNFLNEKCGGRDAWSKVFDIPLALLASPDQLLACLQNVFNGFMDIKIPRSCRQEMCRSQSQMNTQRFGNRSSSWVWNHN